MADELDALFGAFDGDGTTNDDNNNNDVDAQQTDENDEKKEENTALEASNDKDNHGDADDAMETEAADVEKDSDGKQEDDGKKVYTNLMAGASWTSPTEAIAGTAGASKDETKASSKSAGDVPAEKEIATGTSHDKSVRSYSAYPKNYQKPPPIPLQERAKTYPFTLDPFQQQATGYIDQNESVLVAAHTSAGKTAVAEYAVAKSLKAGQRVVYTSPIKALSNQKFRDLQEEFEDVGLMTGDITINPAATALVMTTEILRSMLYRGSELMREVAWVIYDEVHYMRDSERGVVWEESIVLLPHKVRFVFLSATIPNANQFAHWIATVHHQPCHVVYTNYRPVPLQHYIFPQGGDGLHLVVDERGRFRENNFQKAMATLKSGSMDEAQSDFMLSSGNGKQGGGKKRKRKTGGNQSGGDSGSDLHRIVKLVMDRGLNPVIVFSFSKKDCEKYALALKKEDYTDDTEKDLISQVYTNAIESLSEDDRSLPQVVALLPLLKRGVGIHHGGLLPILKEIVEILFSEGLIKALFATETFAIGINMPAKTVVFTNTRKWDGKDFRWLTSGEYIQMSGRAGRRGKDDRGIVIQMLDEKMEPAVCKGILYGDPDPLNSSYRISYNMLLNMMRVEDVDPEYLLRASFHQFQKEAEAPALIEQAKELEEQAGTIEMDPKHASWVQQYYMMDQQLVLSKRKMTAIVRKPEHVLKFLNQAGRMIDISIGGQSFGWGALAERVKKLKATNATAKPGSGAAALAAAAGGDFVYSLEVLLFCVDKHFDVSSNTGSDAVGGDKDDKIRAEDKAEQEQLWRGTVDHCRPVKDGDSPDVISVRIFTVGLESIQRISAAKLFIPNDARSIQSRKNVGHAIKEVKNRLKKDYPPEGVPLLDPIKDLKIKDPEFKTLLARAEELTKRIEAHTQQTELEKGDRDVLVKQHHQKTELIAQAKVLRDEARARESIALRDDLKKMKKVLRRLGHVDATGVIQTKGRTACEVNTANELVVVELIFTGVFQHLSVEQAVALLSCMTFDERNKNDSGDNDPTRGMPGFLANPFTKFLESARTVAKASIACKIDMDEDEFVEKFNPGM